MSVALILTYNFLYPYFGAISFSTPKAVPVHVITNARCFYRNFSDFRLGLSHFWHRPGHQRSWLNFVVYLSPTRPMHACYLKLSY